MQAILQPSSARALSFAPFLFLHEFSLLFYWFFGVCPYNRSMSCVSENKIIWLMLSRTVLVSVHFPLPCESLPDLRFSQGTEVPRRRNGSSYFIRFPTFLYPATLLKGHQYLD